MRYIDVGGGPTGGFLTELAGVRPNSEIGIRFNVLERVQRVLSSINIQEKQNDIIII